MSCNMVDRTASNTIFITINTLVRSTWKGNVISEGVVYLMNSGRNIFAIYLSQYLRSSSTIVLRVVSYSILL